MAHSYIRYAGNGSQVNFTFPFSYIDGSHIFVRVNGVIASYTFLNASTVTLSSAPASGAVVEIRRETPKDSPPVNFQDGSTLLEKDLDLLVTYNLYVAQETVDQLTGVLFEDSTGNFDVGGKRITNLPTPVAPSDAATKEYADSTVSAAAGSASAAAVSASSAASSATSAANSATSAATWASQVSAILDSFDDRYLGVKSSDPTVDNDGNPLVQGAIYFSSVTLSFRVYSGTAWQDTLLTPPDGSITTSKLTDGAVTTAKLADGAVVGDKVPDGSIVQDKLDSVVQFKLAKYRRQSIISGPYNSTTGLPPLPSSSGTDISATGTFLVTAANGIEDRFASITNPVWSVPHVTGTYYLYADINADGTYTLGVTTVAPVLGFSGNGSPIAGRHTFYYGIMKQFVGDGSNSIPSFRIQMGYVVKSGSSITSSLFYTYGCKHTETFGVTATTLLTFPHRQPYQPREVTVALRCDIPEAGYNTGDMVYDLANYSDGTNARRRCVGFDDVNFVLSSNTSTPVINNKTTGSVVAITAGNWSWVLDIDRGWD